MRPDSRHDEVAVVAQLQHRVVWCDAPRRGLGAGVVAACHQPGRLPRGVDAPDLRRHGGDPCDAEQQHDHQRRDRERRFDRDGADIVG